MVETILKNEMEENKMPETEINVANETETELNATNETETDNTDETEKFPVMKVVFTTIGAITTVVSSIISYKQKKLASADYRYRCDTMVRAVEAGADSDTIYRLFRNRSFFEKIFGDRKR